MRLGARRIAAIDMSWMADMAGFDRSVKRAARRTHCEIHRRKSCAAAGALLPAESNFAERAVAKMQAIMLCDMSAQVTWLAQQAKARGYTDLNELFANAPAVYIQFAAMWREAHPLLDVSGRVARQKGV